MSEEKKPRIIAGIDIDTLTLDEALEGIVVQDRVIENYKKEIVNQKTQMSVLKSAFMVVISNMPNQTSTFFFSKSQLSEARNAARLDMMLVESAQLPDIVINTLILTELQRTRRNSLLVLQPAEFLTQFTEVEIEMARARVMKGVVLHMVEHASVDKKDTSGGGQATDAAMDPTTALENLVSLADVRNKKKGGDKNGH